MTDEPLPQFMLLGIRLEYTATEPDEAVAVAEDGEILFERNPESWTAELATTDDGVIYADTKRELLGYLETLGMMVAEAFVVLNASPDEPPGPWKWPTEDTVLL